MAENFLPRTLGIHDGSFHADEVTATAFLVLFDLIDKNLIYRTRDESVLRRCEYVCDVGGIYDPQIKRFDHHQIQYKGNKSSAGMILLYLKDVGIIPPDLYDFFNYSLVIGVDAHDNGQVKLEPGFCSFSQVISNFLPVTYDAFPEEQDKTFFDALDFTSRYLQRLQNRFLYLKTCKEIVRKHMQNRSQCLIFEEPVAWIESFFELGGESHPALFVIMPSQNHWKLRAIPPNLSNRMQMRHPLPLEWAGLHAIELKKISKIPGAIFCHKSRFISIWETKQDALKAFDFVIKRSKKK
ncbi:MAG: MYG1 family protein [Chlamydiota bacterium]